ncbi:MAG: aldo/keto reductase family protein [Phycisphaerales bacterium]|nr:aldo/keto reductase family protein [Phycisphaerae bacterium]NNF41667.1 aldo/keto reductase family protein [Phycisphaerales bacterium]NNM27611.1 aldo/keto reductase family protein [Phycisphaerales bacterium]
MQYRQLGMWGIQLSEVGLGSWLTLNDGSQERADTLHRTAVECGINFFDTANAYGGGVAEEAVGRALAPYRRDALVIATKLFWPVKDWPFPGANDRGLSRKHVFEQCHASLGRMGLDYIDLYQCHRYDEATPLVETCHAMHDLIEQGKVLYWGVSEWNEQQISDAAAICEDHGWHTPASNQPLYNMLERHWEEQVFPTCERLGLGIVNFSPLAEGVLTGKYLDGVPADSRAADEKLGQWIKPRMNEENLARVRKLAAVAKGLDTPLSTLALAWCLRRSELTSTIIGATRPEQIRENAAASELQIDETVWDRVDAILGG